MYAYNENYILPVSHDEVVYGKKSLIDKCWGDTDQKFRQFRVAVMLQATYPGKKMTFMGTEYGQFAEWDYAKGLEWFMLDYPTHRNLREFVAALNRFYLQSPELWEQDFRPEGFRWIYADAADQNMVAFRRYALDGSSLIVVLSFSGSDTTVRIPAKRGEVYDVVFASDSDGAPCAPIRPACRMTEMPLHSPKQEQKKKTTKKKIPVAEQATEKQEEWYFDVPLASMSGLILRPRNEDNNTITLS
jgi:1,4-alpha-glucan branching enzyme